MIEEFEDYSLVQAMVPVCHNRFGFASYAVHVLLVACGLLIAVGTKAAGPKHKHFVTHMCHTRSGVWCFTEASDGKY